MTLEPFTAARKIHRRCRRCGDGGHDARTCTAASVLLAGVETSLCNRCGAVPASAGKKRCDRCREYMTQRSTALKAKRLARNLCERCGKNPPREGHQTCECASAYDQARKERLFAEGACVECGEVREDPGRKLCSACSNYYANRAAAKRDAHKADSRLCPRCGDTKKLETQSKWCDGCKQKLREAGQRLKSEVLKAYGGVCQCCAESNPNFLTIDHVEGGGTKHRDSISGKIYRWLKARKFPPGFQVLCFNCNCGRAVNGGICPHALVRAQGNQ